MNNYRYGSYLDRFHHLYPNEEIIEKDLQPEKYVFYLIEPKNDLSEVELTDHADPYLLERVDTFVRELFNQETKGRKLENLQQASDFDTSIPSNDEPNELHYLSRRNKSKDKEDETHTRGLGCSKISTLINSSSSDNTDCYCAPYCMMIGNVDGSPQNLQDNQTEDIYRYETDSQYSRESPEEFYEAFIADTENESFHIIDDDDDYNLMIDEGNSAC